MKARSNATPVSPRHIVCLALSLITMAALAFTTQPVQADKEVPFRAAFITEFESVVIPPMAHIQVIGEGKATHLGKATAVTTDQEVNLIRTDECDLHVYRGERRHGCAGDGV